MTECSFPATIAVINDTDASNYQNTDNEIIFLESNWHLHLFNFKSLNISLSMFNSRQLKPCNSILKAHSRTFPQCATYN